MSSVLRASCSAKYVYVVLPIAAYVEPTILLGGIRKRRSVSRIRSKNNPLQAEHLPPIFCSAVEAESILRAEGTSSMVQIPDSVLDQLWGLLDNDEKQTLTHDKRSLLAAQCILGAVIWVPDRISGAKMLVLVPIRSWSKKLIQLAPQSLLIYEPPRISSRGGGAYLPLLISCLALIGRGISLYGGRSACCLMI